MAVQHGRAERYRDRARGARLGGSVESVTRLAERLHDDLRGAKCESARQGADQATPEIRQAACSPPSRP